MNRAAHALTPHSHPALAALIDTIIRAYPNGESGRVVPALTLSRPDAEVLLGVLASERYNADTEAV
ncbi:MAG TPA: hypothetical protein VF729_08910 [Solirubrobacterales bacterium]